MNVKISFGYGIFNIDQVNIFNPYGIFEKWIV